MILSLLAFTIAVVHLDFPMVKILRLYSHHDKDFVPFILVFLLLIIANVSLLAIWGFFLGAHLNITFN